MARREQQGVEARQDKLARSLEQYDVLQQRTDTLVQQYSKADSSSPSKIILGLSRMASSVEFNNEAKKNNEQITQLSKQVDFWISSSQTTLIALGPSSNQKEQTRDFSEAQDAARETLKVIKRIAGASDDLSLTQDMVKGELVGLQRGLSGAWARLALIIDFARKNIQKIIEFKLFYKGNQYPLHAHKYQR